MKKFNDFHILTPTFDLASLQASFSYRFDDEPTFTETIVFPQHDLLRNEWDQEILQGLLFHVSLALGVSYYKLYPTQDIIVQSGTLDPEQQKFRHDFYIQGLGEFFYTNDLDPRGLANFTSTSDKTHKKKAFGLSEKYLVPIGGGKDSIVSIELLKEQGKDIYLWTHGKDYAIHQATQEISGWERIITKRTIDPLLIAMSKEEGYYNGHVPITGMISFISLLMHYLYGFKATVFSNEKSANFGNTQRKGLTINHQWSKSLLFEESFSAYIQAYIHDEIEYFSLLRPWYEICIAQKFSRHKQYFSSFSSCNRNFHLEGTRTSRRCLQCPKCLFVYAILRPFLSSEETKNIRGEELYENKSLLGDFQELWGVKGIKPFECVGTYDEVQYATRLSIQQIKKTSAHLPDVLFWFDEHILSTKTMQERKNLEKKLLEKKEI